MILAMLRWQLILKNILNFSKTILQIKKYKAIKKEAKGMDFENYAERIKALRNFETFEHPKN